MTETKFTPGPWFISKKFVVGPRDQEDGQSYGMIVGVADVYGENRSADAHLIAAAPDLYEVVEAMARFDGRNNNHHLKNMAKAALAKARGEA